MTDPRPQAPGAKPSEQDPPVDWRARSQGLEEAASFALAAIPSKHPEPCGTDACWLCAAETTLRDALGLPDEEGEGQDSGYEARSAHPRGLRPRFGVWLVRLRKDHVLAAGRQRRELRVRPGFTPERNYRRERIRHALLDLWVPLVPRPLRSRRPFARYFWQQAEVDHINARARALAVELGWDTSEPESAAPVAAARPPIDRDVEAGRDVSGEGDG